MFNVLAVDVGGTRFRVGLFDQEGRRLVVSEDDTFRHGGRDWMLEQIRERARLLLKETDGPVRACGVSFGGPVDFERQRVHSIHSPGWEDFALAAWVEEVLNLPCRVDNDANAGALGEFHFGAGRGCQSVFYVTISTGIGGGLVLNGRVHRGKDGMAGELGHMPVSDSGALCSCGAKGCLEMLCSGNAIARRAQEWARRRPEASERLLANCGGRIENITAREVFRTAAEGGNASGHIVRETARWLARGFLAVIRILNPDKIVLGGGVARAGKTLLDPIRVFLQEFASPAIRYTTEIVQAELGDYSSLYGAATLGLELAAGQGKIKT